MIITEEQIERIRQECGWEEIPLWRIEFADRLLIGGDTIEAIIECFQFL